MQQHADRPGQADTGNTDPAPTPLPGNGEPVWIRSAILSGILFLMVMYTLYVAASLLIPITLAFLLSLVLSPLVRFLVHLRVPQVLSALLVMFMFVGFLVALVYAVAQPAVNWMERAPTELRILEYKLAWVKQPIAELEEARKQLDKITNVNGDEDEDADADEDESSSRPEPSFSLVEMVLSAAPSVAYGIAVTLILMLFVLGSGDAFLNKAVQVTPTLADKRRVVETGRGIQHHVSTYLATIAMINAVVGVAVGVAMYLLEVPNPILWGLMVGLLNFIPYIGVLVSMIVVTFVGLLTFDEPINALWPPLAIFGINVVEGQFLTPIVAGRRLALSPVAVFLSLVVMGWIWGILGVLMAVPLLAIIKLVCEEVEALTWVATFLGDD